MTKLVATRGPHGTVTCAQPSCRRDLPGIWCMEGDWPGADGYPVPYLFMPAGWQQGDWDSVARGPNHPDGIWRVTQRGLRSHDFLSGRAPDVRRDFHAVLTPEDLINRGGVKGQIAHYLPSVAICPFCRTRQWLDPDVLGVDPLAYESGSPVSTYALPEDRQDRSRDLARDLVAAFSALAEEPDRDELVAYMQDLRQEFDASRGSLSVSQARAVKAAIDKLRQIQATRLTGQERHPL